MAPCPGTDTIALSTPLGKDVECPSTADVKSMIPVAPPARVKREANAQLDALPLDAVTEALGGGLPVKQKRHLDTLPLNSITDVLGGGLLVKEKRQLDSLPLDTVTDAIGGGLPLKERRQLHALKV